MGGNKRREYPAFPVRATNRDDHAIVDAFGVEIPPKKECIHYGLTDREYFAAHAPTPPSEWYAAERDKAAPANMDPIAALIRWRWHYADLMIAEREK